MKCDKLKICWFDVNSGELSPLYKKVDVDEAIAELKQAIHDAEMAKDDAEAANTEYREDIKKLNAENEKLKTWMKEHFYCDEMLVVEKREHKADRRALWIARAERAEAEHAHWATIWFCNIKISLNINKSSVSQDPYKSNTFRNASEWRNMWYDIASKCRAKAEEDK